jgi:hypothetical protein
MKPSLKLKLPRDVMPGSVSRHAFWFKLHNKSKKS